MQIGPMPQSVLIYLYSHLCVRSHLHLQHNLRLPQRTIPAHTLPQHHPHYPPTPLDHQRLGHTGHLAPLVHPSSQIKMGNMGTMDDMRLGLSMDHMALADMGAQTQAITDNPRMQGDMQAADPPAPTYP